MFAGGFWLALVSLEISCLEEGVSAKSIVIAFGAGFFCRFFEWEIAFLGLLSYNNFIG